jgi:hypothetical protein
MVVQAALISSKAILLEAGLGFLVQARSRRNAPGGGMLAESRQYVYQAPWFGTTPVTGALGIGSRASARFRVNVDRGPQDVVAEPFSVSAASASAPSSTTIPKARKTLPAAAATRGVPTTGATAIATPCTSSAVECVALPVQHPGIRTPR